MKMKRCLIGFLTFVLFAGNQLSAQETNAALKLFEDTKAKAEKGDALAQCVLGEMYDPSIRSNLNQSKIVPQDYADAVKWYRSAAEQGCAEAQFNLGNCYEFGKGVTNDDTEAAKWYRKAAEQNNAQAQYYLGNCYRNGKGVAKNEVEAVQWFRKAAEQNHAGAQCNLGACYAMGVGVAKDAVEAVKWYRKAAEKNYAGAQYGMGCRYSAGDGVTKDEAEAVKWYRKAAEQNFADAQFNLGGCYHKGDGVPQNDEEAVKWFEKAAEQNHADAQFNLANRYINGEGVAKDYVAAYKWRLLAAAHGDEISKKAVDSLESIMTRDQIAEGQRLAREFRPRRAASSGNLNSSENATASGTGFFITDDGYLITNEHVVKDAAHVRLVTSGGWISAKIVKVDAANDLALLKAEGRVEGKDEGRIMKDETGQRQASSNQDFNIHPSAFNLTFKPLPIAASRAMKLGGTVATVGFPNIGLQGFAPKFARGEIASLSGAGDDARYFQISVPVQPGNSGGALVDERGSVVGVVSAKLNAAAALASSGALPENVNYAVKSSYLLSFLESVPEVSAKLKEANTKEIKFEEVVERAKQAAVLVLVY